MNRDKLAKTTRGYEGCEYEAYDDTQGYRTVAIGFNLDRVGARTLIEQLGLDFDLVYDGEVALSDGHCQALFDPDLDIAIADAKSLVSNFDTHPEDVRIVLADMAYNLGKPKFSKFVKAIAAFEANDYCTAAHEMAASLWAKQTGRRAADHIATVQAHCT